MERKVRIRYRIDGALYERGKYDISLLPAVVARIKIIGGMDIAEKRKPQDGRITQIVDRMEYDIRGSVLPTTYGEKVVMRLASKTGLTRSKEEHGMKDWELKQFEHIISNPNGILLVTGPTGSGKTTLLNIVGGLDRYDDGDLIINGISTKKYKDRDWDTYRNHSIGFVFQSYNLIPHQNVLSNVELALTIGGISPSERKKRAIEALKKVGLGEQLHKKPNQMSGGQMQRVAIARALVNNPDIVLADEPTGALDSDTSVQVMELLKEVAKEKLVIMVTHNPELAEQYANRIIKVKDGVIIDDSNPVEGCEDEVALPQDTKKASMSKLTSLSLSFNNLNR